MHINKNVFATSKMDVSRLLAPKDDDSSDGEISGDEGQQPTSKSVAVEAASVAARQLIVVGGRCATMGLLDTTLWDKAKRSVLAAFRASETPSGFAFFVDDLRHTVGGG